MSQLGAPYSSAAAAVLLASCGAGTAAIVASSDSGGGGNSSPALANLQVPAAKNAPAHIVVELSDREGESARLELLLAGGKLGEPTPLTAVSGSGFPTNGSMVAIPGGNQPLVLQLEWRFPEESFADWPDWPEDGSYVEDLELRARLSTGAELVLGDDESFSIGNDPPVVTDVTPIVPVEGEVAGIARIEVTVEDSSDDVVDVLAEYDIVGDDPDQGWQPAIGFGLTDVQVLRGGTTLDFFWDTDAERAPDPDLHDLEREVVLRFTASDSAATGPSRESEPLRVDNNEEPIVQLDSGPLLLNPDGRRGIPVPFRVIDEEGDPVEVVFQWRRVGEEFPSLDVDGDGTVENEEIDEVLADPLRRQEHHVCSEYPRYSQGRTVSVDEDTVRLPELASSESWILANGIVGRTLELLRPSAILQPIAQTWRANPLASPIAALPLGDGISALVLDSPGQGRLSEVELATGTVVREVATFGPGIPSALALERAPGRPGSSRAALVALEDSGLFRIERVELATGTVTQVALSDGGIPAPVRGIASLGEHAAVFTAGSSLLFLDYGDPEGPRSATLLGGLATPWGVAVDPQAADRIYVAESDALAPRGAGRVLAIEVDTHARVPLVAGLETLQVLEHPRALAFEREGRRLLTVSSPSGGGSQLVGLDIGLVGGDRSFAIGERSSELASIACGPAGLRLAAAPASNDLVVGGGIEQERSIVSYLAHDPVAQTGQEVTVSRPFEPAPRLGQVWRISGELLSTHPGAASVQGPFLWDAGSDLGGGRAFLRALPRDSEPGIPEDGRAPKTIRVALDVESPAMGMSPPFLAEDFDADGDQDIANGTLLRLQVTPGVFDYVGLDLPDVPRAMAAADLDADGRIDLATYCEGFSVPSNLWLNFQTSPGVFTKGVPVLPDGYPEGLNSLALVAADLDGDGDADLATANRSTTAANSLKLFFQGSVPGSFDPEPLVIGGFRGADYPAALAAADLDQDGDVDLVAANSDDTVTGSGGDTLTVYYQEGPRDFRADRPLGNSPDTREPRSVAAEDLDADGDVDLVSANAFSDSLTVFFQRAPGAFDRNPLILPVVGSSFPQHVAPADVDSDGDVDLVTATNTAVVFFQERPGVFGPMVRVGNTPLGGPLDVADMDGDGDLDLLHSFGILLASSPGDFGSEPQAVGTGQQPWDVVSGDLDSDGDLDLVGALPSTNALPIFVQEEPGSFAAEPILLPVPGPPPFGAGPIQVAIADLDTDGDPDLTCLNNITHQTAVFSQRADGTFEPPLLLDATGYFSITDLDGDGDLDLVSVGSDGGQTAFLQDPKTQFSPLSIAPLGGTTTPVDVDLDGDVDLALPAFGDLAILVQTGDLLFERRPLGLSFRPSDVAVRIAASDVDADGDFDLASMNWTTFGSPDRGSVTLFFQGELGFDPEPLVIPIAATSLPRSFVLSDLDSNGTLDLACAYQDSDPGPGGVCVFSQRSPRIFDVSSTMLGAELYPQPQAVLAVDLDGDGDIDLVTGNKSDLATTRSISIFWGGR